MSRERTQVAIVGAGPAGLVLAHLLDREGIASVVLEAQHRSYVEGRIRAGILEHDVAALLREIDAGSRMNRIGLRHDGIELRFAEGAHRIDFATLVGRSVMLFGQHEVVADLIASRVAAGGDIRFGARVTRLSGLDTDRPAVSFEKDGTAHELVCDVVAGCDGFHGACRRAIPQSAIAQTELTYPFAWLGILADAPPPSHELIYARHARGFALASMRSPTVSRMYLQCAPDEDLDRWSDSRIWDELAVRLGAGAEGALTPGPITQRSVTALRAFVAAPMRFGRMFLAGDAAHIVPPTGAKGMNLAVADVCLLGRALSAFFRAGRADLLEEYSDACLARVWRALRFSNFMTMMLHVDPRDGAFEARLKQAELAHVASSRAAATALAENYVGLPLPR